MRKGTLIMALSSDLHCALSCVTDGWAAWLVISVKTYLMSCTVLKRNPKQRILLYPQKKTQPLAFILFPTYLYIIRIN